MPFSATSDLHLTDYFEVVPTGIDRYEAATDSPMQRRNLFGGALMGQALRAAALTTGAQLLPSSLHADFVRAGVSGQATTFTVERVSDSAARAHRQVTVSQGERLIMNCSTVFGAPDHDVGLPAVDPTGLRHPPAPSEGLTTFRTDDFGAIVVHVHETDTAPREARYAAWARSATPLPDDPILQCCAIAYLTDAGPPAVSAAAIGVRPGGPNLEAGSIMSTSLNHAVWFHRPGLSDDWTFLTGLPMSTAWSRGLTVGGMYDATGVIRASFVQEMLIRQ